VCEDPGQGTPSESFPQQKDNAVADQFDLHDNDSMESANAEDKKEEESGSENEEPDPISCIEHMADESNGRKETEEEASEHHTQMENGFSFVSFP